jgi:hypothetical protein
MIKQNQMQALLALQVHKNVLLFEQREVEQKDFDRLHFCTKKKHYHKILDGVGVSIDLSNTNTLTHIRFFFIYMKINISLTHLLYNRQK